MAPSRYYNIGENKEKTVRRKVREENLKEYLLDIPKFVIEEYWITGDVREVRGEEKWLNLIL